MKLALLAVAVYAVLAYFASIGVYHYFGLVIQALCVPVFFAIGLGLGLLVARAER